MAFSCLRRTFALLLLLAAATIGRALSVIPPTFAELVAEADYVVRGVVTDVHAVEIDTPQGQGIQTLVTLHVERTLKGNPGTDITLKLLGGRVGRHSLLIPGMPKFTVGEQEIVFVANNGRVICPLIAAGHGRYHVRHDTATNRDIVARDNGMPLTSIDEIAHPLDQSPSAQGSAASAPALSRDDFETKIATAVRAGQPVLQP